MERTRIDDNLKTAMLGLVIGIGPVGIYWIMFGDSGSPFQPWKIALTVLVISSLVLIANYIFNRQSKRLVWAGVATCIGMFGPMWLMFGSWCFFYFGFAPLPTWLRYLGFSTCTLIVAWWVVLSWWSYRRATVRFDLTKKLYMVRGDRIIYPAGASDAEVSELEGPGRSWIMPMWVVSILGPIGGGFAISTIHMGTGNSTLHVPLIFLSVFALPATCWLFAKMIARIFFFHVYLAWKLERQTGKKVILAP
ncbi:hypothetical protein LGM89_34035 [Burkholderia sp. AU31624]|uniref:hypothetical protein n=1 Tax=Burkholderia sp. AU31624 TaxID=2879629 RepID=UPI001CF339EF|nr:hypothetical protein [Burkholderia sp. AU31624]MCA8258309.1 hypothetical protein [Burkholderia sp. AU31624]